MPRTLAESRTWVEQGTQIVVEALAGLDDPAFAAASALPGWTRKQLVAHLAANAEAIGNLVHWAATGERTPMYSSPEQRNADIQAGVRRSGEELREWFTSSAHELDRAMSALGDEQWAAEVVTAQGRTVPASETPWMRAREVMVHAVDLDTGITFAELPPAFVAALVDDIAAKRSGSAGSPAAGPALTVTATDADRTWEIAGEGEPAAVTGPLAAVTAYLSGRGDTGVTAQDGAAPPVLPAWL